MSIWTVSIMCRSLFFRYDCPDRIVFVLGSPFASGRGCGFFFVCSVKSPVENVKSCGRRLQSFLHTQNVYPTWY